MEKLCTPLEAQKLLGCIGQRQECEQEMLLCFIRGVPCLAHARGKR